MKKKTASDLLPHYDFSSGVRGKYVERAHHGGIVGAEQARSAAQPAAPKSPTQRQSEYLAFIAKYIERWGRAPAESDIERHFMVSAPTVNQMVRTLERRGFITRQPGVYRSIRICIELAGPSGRDEAQLGAGSSSARVKLPRVHRGVKPPPSSKVSLAAILELSVQERVQLAMLILESVASVSSVCTCPFSCSWRHCWVSVPKPDQVGFAARYAGKQAQLPAACLQVCREVQGEPERFGRV